MYHGPEHIIGDILIGEKATIVLKKTKLVRFGDARLKSDFQLIKWLILIISRRASHSGAMCYSLGDKLFRKMEVGVRAQPQQDILRKERVAQALKDANLLSICQSCFLCFFM